MTNCCVWMLKTLMTNRDDALIKYCLEHKNSTTAHHQLSDGHVSAVHCDCGSSVALLGGQWHVQVQLSRLMESLLRQLSVHSLTVICPSLQPPCCRSTLIHEGIQPSDTQWLSDSEEIYCNNNISSQSTARHSPVHFCTLNHDIHYIQWAHTHTHVYAVCLCTHTPLHIHTPTLGFSCVSHINIINWYHTLHPACTASQLQSSNQLSIFNVPPAISIISIADHC